jgi:hypothetical protein
MFEARSITTCTVAEHRVTLAYAAAVLTVSYPNVEPADGKSLLDQAATVDIVP